MELPSSVAGVIDVTVFAGKSPHWLLIDVPHGATRKSDYDAVVGKLKSPLPAQLEHFFFVNTDIGAPEGAEWLGRTLSAQGINVVVARCLMPRTFIDPNRVIAQTEQGVVKDGLTAAVPGYITEPADFEWLSSQHARYHEVVDALYREVCRGRNGLALQLHSYSPRSVGIEKVDANIVNALHAAYVPEVYATWPERPVIDVISALKDGSFRTAPKLVDAMMRAWADDGIPAKENATYHLAPAAMGYVYAAAYPYQVVCVELNRGHVADPFVPFGVSPISEAKVAKLVGPIGRVLSGALLG
jgi:hypothetical protein